MWDSWIFCLRNRKLPWLRNCIISIMRQYSSWGAFSISTETFWLNYSHLFPTTVRKTSLFTDNLHQFPSPVRKNAYFTDAQSDLDLRPACMRQKVAGYYLLLAGCTSQLRVSMPKFSEWVMRDSTLSLHNCHWGEWLRNKVEYFVKEKAKLLKKRKIFMCW